MALTKKGRRTMGGDKISAAGADNVTTWIKKLGNGDPRATEAIWEAYFGKLLRYANRKLEAMPRRMADEEDVAVSAMHSFYRGFAEGRFKQLNDREDLWKLLVTITARKAWATLRRNKAEKRGAGGVRGESVFVRTEREEDAGIGEVVGVEPTPELAAMVVENSRRMLDLLGDESLQRVAILRLEGYTNEEIAQRLNCVTRSVERKLERIRAKWSKEQSDES